MSEFLTVEGLSHAAIRTRNIMDSVRYYMEVLGMREAFRMYREDGTAVESCPHSKEVIYLDLSVTPSKYDILRVDAEDSTKEQ